MVGLTDVDIPIILWISGGLLTNIEPFTLSLMLMSTSRRMMKRRSLNPNHIQAVSKEPVSGILKAAIINHAGEGEGVA